MTWLIRDHFLFSFVQKTVFLCKPRSPVEWELHLPCLGYLWGHNNCGIPLPTAALGHPQRQHHASRASLSLQELSSPASRLPRNGNGCSEAAQPALPPPRACDIPDTHSWALGPPQQVHPMTAESACSSQGLSARDSVEGALPASAAPLSRLHRHLKAFTFAVQESSAFAGLEGTFRQEGKLRQDALPLYRGRRLTAL